MSAASSTEQPSPSAAFDRVVVYVDDASAAPEVARKAAAIRAPAGTLHLCAVADTRRAMRAGVSAAAVADRMRRRAADALERAAAEGQPTTAALLEGSQSSCVLRKVREHEATLLALSAPDHPRTSGLLFGTVTYALLRDAPCSVLVVRPESWPEGGPKRLVVGVDGSSESTRAVAAARSLAERFGAELTLVVGLGGKLTQAAAVTDVHPAAVVDERAPVDALVDASERADLVVVGSRGRHGPAILGSVSERLAHRARSSVLVVRGASDASRRLITLTM